MGNGLGFAGAISGMGQNLNQGLQTLNSGLVQMGVNQSLAKNDREFQLEKLKLQMEHESQLQKEKMAADRQNTLDTIAAQGAEQRKGIDLKNASDEKIAGMKDAGENARLDKTLSAHQTEAFAKLGLTREIEQGRTAMLEKHYNQMYALGLREQNEREGRVSTFVTNDGRIAVMSPKGKGIGYLAIDGEEVHSQKDLPQSTLTQLGDLQKQRLELTTKFKAMKFPSETDKAEYNRQLKTLNGQIQSLLNGEQASAPAAVPNFNYGIYGDKGTGDSSYQFPLSIPGGGPAPAPVTGSSPTKAAPGFAGAAQGLIPGAGIIQNYLNKK